jgi:hypothetical protein
MLIFQLLDKLKIVKFLSHKLSHFLLDILNVVMILIFYLTDLSKYFLFVISAPQLRKPFCLSKFLLFLFFH